MEQRFEGGMSGCAGTVTFANRATLCAPGVGVCQGIDWVGRRGGAAPTYSYWTDNDLLWTGPGSGNCSVSPLAGGTSCSPGNPMRVCAGATDPLGNTCTLDRRRLWRELAQRALRRLRRRSHRGDPLLPRPAF